MAEHDRCDAVATLWGTTLRCQHTPNHLGFPVIHIYQLGAPLSTPPVTIQWVEPADKIVPGDSISA